MNKLLVSIAAVILIGCASFSTNTFRTEQTLTGIAYTAYVGYTNALFNGTLKISSDQSNEVRSARLKFAASVKTVDLWRTAYETNSAVQPQLQAALDALSQNTTNFVNLIHLFETP
jgi:hypothetical protein